MFPSSEDRFVRYMAQCLVSLGCISTRSYLITPGLERKFFTSAFIMEVSGDLYLVTAGHVLNDIRVYLNGNAHLRHEFVLFIGFGRFSIFRELIRFPYRTPIFCEDRHTGLDFGAIRLTSLERQLVEQNPVLIVEEQGWDQDLPAEFAEFAMVGLPVQNMELDIPGLAAIQPVYLRSHPLDAAPEPYSHHTDPMFYFQIPEDESIPHDLNIVGMSGCPVFAFYKPEGSADMKTIPFAIQRSWLSESRRTATCNLRFAGTCLRQAVVR